MVAHETPTEALRAEHERILEVLEAFEETAERAERGGITWEALEEFLAFFRLYVGACHHGKEEDLLFPALEERGLPASGGPLAVMLEEHRKGRELVEAMSLELPRAREGAAGAAVRLADAAREYVDLLRRHIGKENPAVFDAADRLLTGPACRRLCEAFGSADEQGFDGRSVVELERLAERLLHGRA